MTVTNTISKLRNTGYKVELVGGGTVKLSWEGKGKPDRGKVAPLIESLRAHKPQVADYLSKSKYLEAVFQETWNRVNDLYAKDPDLLGRYDAVEGNRAMNEVDRAWKDCLAGKGPLHGFKEAVGDWERVVA